jgi:hypothetical protein
MDFSGQKWVQKFQLLSTESFNRSFFDHVAFVRINAEFWIDSPYNINIFHVWYLAPWWCSIWPGQSHTHHDNVISLSGLICYRRTKIWLMPNWKSAIRRLDKSTTVTRQLLLTSYVQPPSSNKCMLGHVLNQNLLTLTNFLGKSRNIYDTKLIWLFILICTSII